MRLVTIVIADYDMIDADGFYRHIFKLYGPEKMVLLTDVMEIHTLEFRKLPEALSAENAPAWTRYGRLPVCKVNAV